MTAHRTRHVDPLMLNPIVKGLYLGGPRPRLGLWDAYRHPLLAGLIVAIALVMVWVLAGGPR